MATEKAKNEPALEYGLKAIGNQSESYPNSNIVQENGLKELKVENPKLNDDTNRGNWGSGLEFLMSCIAMSVGLGNIWRFPFVAYENGGGAFLIPYLLVLLLIGRPVYYMEMCLGQFTGVANAGMFHKLAPALKGVGYGQLIGAISVATYYCSLMAITLFYLVNSFTSELPWSKCDSSWTADQLLNATCIPSKSNLTAENSISSSEAWFTIEVLKEWHNIDNGVGLPEWRLTICLFVSWLVTLGVCVKGVQSSGKASYFLAIFPYVILVALLVRALTLEGAWTGILYFIEPKWEKLADATVWYSAVSQCFFSLNIGFGTVIMYSSYNKFDHNINRDALVVSLLDTFTSLLAGTIIFGILGNLALKMNASVTDVVKSGGTGLAFISYPEAVARFQAVPWLFAILFFFMLFVLGVGSLVALQAAAFTVILDSFPKLKVWHVSSFTALAGFLIGLVYITPGGQFVFTLVDFFGGTFIFVVLTTVEVVAIVWWYGIENICADVQFMLKSKVGWYWRLCWGYITPVVLLVVLIYFLATLERLKYNGKVIPDKALGCGWALAGIAILQPVFWWIHYLYKKRKMGLKTALLVSLQHTRWGPKDPDIREEWQKFKKERSEEKTKRGNSLKHFCCSVILRRK